MSNLPKVKQHRRQIGILGGLQLLWGGRTTQECQGGALGVGELGEKELEPREAETFGRGQGLQTQPPWAGEGGVWRFGSLLPPRSQAPGGLCALEWTSEGQVCRDRAQWALERALMVFSSTACLESCNHGRTGCWGCTRRPPLLLTGHP